VADQPIGLVWRYLSCVILLFAAIPATDASAQTSGPSGRIDYLAPEFVREEGSQRVLGFGQRLTNQQVHLIDRTIWDGERALDVERVAVSCSCTEVRLGARRVLPGEDIELKVSIDGRNIRGPFAVTVSLVTDDPAFPIRLYRFEGEFKDPSQTVVSVPGQIDFGRLFPVESRRQVISLRRPRSGGISSEPRGRAMSRASVSAESTVPWLSVVPIEADGRWGGARYFEVVAEGLPEEAGGRLGAIRFFEGGDLVYETPVNVEVLAFTGEISPSELLVPFDELVERTIHLRLPEYLAFDPPDLSVYRIEASPGVELESYTALGGGLDGGVWIRCRMKVPAEAPGSPILTIYARDEESDLPLASVGLSRLPGLYAP